MSAFEIIPVFLDSPQGRIFVIHRRPNTHKIKSGVVLVPPFAEELNRSRHMLTLLADSLAQDGFHVTLPDLYGTGDSEGEFADASWIGWLDQLTYCISSMQKDYDLGTYSLVALRTGALLVADCLTQLPSTLENIVFWQPIINGDEYLTKFLRLRLASNMLAGTDSVDTQSIKTMIANGEMVEVAGYALTSAVTVGLSKAVLDSISPSHLPSTYWIDLTLKRGELAYSPGRNLTEAWESEGADILHEIITGESFWNSSKITENYELVSKTIAFLKKGK